MARKSQDVTRMPTPPAWGEYIRERRERQGRSIRQAAMTTDLSDSYWGQVERGFQTTKNGLRTITPSRATLIAIAEALRLSSRDTNELLNLAGHRPIAVSDGSAPRGSDVDLTDLSRNDIALLNAIADRFRQARNEAAHGKGRPDLAWPAVDTDVEPPLRAVAARGKREDSRTATELAKAERKRQTGKP